ncbi:MAG: hypothetical protein K2J84_06350 [Bacteroidaceae bacterium]|nr:hypothetical protein [Bacteroidaceae bacterium]
MTDKKDVEPTLSLVPHSEGSRIALYIETSNAESPTLCMYNNHSNNNLTIQDSQEPMAGMCTIHP